MGQVTLYLDDETEAKMREAAKSAGLSQSRWVMNLIRERTATEWPASIAKLKGAWADMPTVEELRKGMPEDVAREPI